MHDRRNYIWWWIRFVIFYPVDRLPTLHRVQLIEKLPSNKSARYTVVGAAIVYLNFLQDRTKNAAPLNDGSFGGHLSARDGDGYIRRERDGSRTDPLVHTRIHQYSIGAFLFRKSEFIGRRQSHPIKNVLNIRVGKSIAILGLQRKFTSPAMK